jgi:hypothetical protein
MHTENKKTGINKDTNKVSSSEKEIKARAQVFSNSKSPGRKAKKNAE